jgi:hypothetical protein
MSNNHSFAALGHDHFAYWHDAATRLLDQANVIMLHAAAAEMESHYVPSEVAEIIDDINALRRDRARIMLREAELMKKYAQVSAEAAEKAISKVQEQ